MDVRKKQKSLNVRVRRGFIAAFPADAMNLASAELITHEVGDVLFAANLLFLTRRCGFGILAVRT